MFKNFSLDFNYSNKLKLFRSLLSLLRRKRKIQLIFVLILMIIASVVELISLSSVIPFLSLITGNNTNFGNGGIEILT